ncbi:hypothetical protein [Cohnella sp.]|uniref:hypothetical protein n=1 Tax=Cohnella sp. TaxID=1883426 RepID=UPI003703A5EC
MNEFEPGWYAKLKGDPVNRRTFTAAHMERIQRQAAQSRELKTRRRQASQRKRMAAGAAVLVILFGLALNYSRLEKWVATRWSGDTQEQIPAGPSHEQQPPTETANEQQGKLIPVKLTTAFGMLKDALPFDVEQIRNVSLYDELEDKRIDIPREREYVVIQNLAWISLDAAKAERSDVGRTVTLRVEAVDGIYTIPYNLEQNTVDLGNGSYYADDMLLLLVKGLAEPDTRLAEADRILEQARVELSEENSGKRDDSFSLDADRLLVGGKDFDEWQSQLLLFSQMQPFRFYDSVTEKVKTMGEYGGVDNLISLNSRLLFASDQYKTKDGVGVGLTKQEVLSKLGKPNLETETEWGYRTGDYIRFYLYFDAGVVKYMSITMPA